MTIQPPNEEVISFVLERSTDPEIQLMIGIQHMIEFYQTKGLDELAIKRVLDHIKAKRVMAG